MWGERFAPYGRAVTDNWPHIAPAPGTPACGPPSFEPERGWWVTRHADVRAALLALAPQGPPEVLANLIGLLVQACDATAGLIGAAAHHLLAPAAPRTAATARTADLLAEVLRLDPPVRATRRVTVEAVRLGGRELPAGSPVLLRFDAANRDPQAFTEPATLQPGRPGAGLLTFGTGERGCPGDRHALALATGVLDVLRERCRRGPTPVRHEPHPTLRVPTTLEVTVR